MIRNSNDDHTAWAAVNIHASDKVTGYGQIVVTDSTASFRGPSLDHEDVPGTPPGFDYTAASDLGSYSALGIRWVSLEAGMRQILRPSLIMNYALSYDDYNDRQPYLFDTTGRNLGFVVRANWEF